MTRQKIEARKGINKEIWPYSPDELLSEVQQGPIREKYDLIFGSLDPTYRINEYGYAVTRSRRTATKVWSMASNWEIFLTPNKFSME